VRLAMSMNEKAGMNEKTRTSVPVAVIPTPLKLRPAARRQHLLDMMRARVPLDRAPPPKAS
jgi:hypothetical protein